MLESNLHSDNTFLTLTYADEHLPKSSTGLATLDPRDLKNFLKLLRRKIEPSKIRYFAVGEYGNETKRPHYHLAVFGYPNCSRGNSSYSHFRRNCCSHCDLIRSTWGRGQVYLGDLSVNSAQYIAGYVTKKLTAKDDPALLGRHPEFGRMSLKPGIGADFMHEVASTLLGLATFDQEPDVPPSLQHGTRKLPLGRYLRRHLRHLTGREKAAPQETIDLLQEELQPLRETAFENSRSFKAEVVQDSAQKVLNAETKAKIFKSARKL